MGQTLNEGGVIRKLFPSEVARYRDHLLRLDAESRRSRFAGSVSDEYVTRFASTPFPGDAILHGFFVDGVLRGVAEMRPTEPRAGREAELAFSIEQPWQSHGIGTALLERTLLAARNRGFKTLRMSCLFENDRMRQLARKFDAEFHTEYGALAGEMHSADATPLSVMREWVADGHGLATAIIDAQSRMLGGTRAAG